MLILGVLPALACVWIRMYVKEPEVWAENKKIQNTTKQQVTLPLFAIFKRKYLWNTLTGCLWMAANFCVYYAIWAMLGTYLQKELGWTPAQVAVPVFWGNILTFLACSFWGAMSEKVGRRWALMIPSAIAIFFVPIYLDTTDPTWFLGSSCCSSASSAARMRSTPAGCRNAFRPRSGRPRRASSITRARFGVRLSRRC